MTWLPFALLAPILWAIVNHVDKYLLEKHFKGYGVGALVLYSSFFGIILLPMAHFFDRSIFQLSVGTISLLILTGLMTAVAIAAYLTALNREEASLVVPIYQTIPFFGFIFAYFMLGETLTFQQIIGGLIIIAGSMIISLEISEEQKSWIKWSPLLLMLLSSVLYGLHETIFKLVASDVGFWPSIFWAQIGLIIFGIITALMKRSYWRQFTNSFKRHGLKIFSINATNEGLTLIGNLALLYALTLAPVVLVMLTAAYQPVFVLLIGTTLTIFFPRIATEKITGQHLAHKIVSIVIILLGAIVLYN